MSRQSARGRNGKKGGSPVLTILFVIALGVFLFSAWKLYTIYSGYKAGVDEYNSLEEAYTKDYTEEEDSSGPEEEEPAPVGPSGRERLIEDAEPPLTVDFDELKKINPEVVGWIYVDAFPETISYPLLRGTDNDYYLHHTFKKQYLFAGSIFENFENRADFTDPNTIIYGHNMKNRSMFGNLKFLKEQERYDKDPYFWILTPQGNFRYKIYAVMDTPVNSDVYTLFSDGGPEVLEWMEKQQKASTVENDIPLEEDDLTVTLSTCTANSSVRCVVLGKLVSSARPVRTEIESPVKELGQEAGGAENAG